MKIWIINHYAAPLTMAGGSRHYNFALELMKRGHEVLLIASNYNHFLHTYIETNKQPGEIDFTYDVPFLWIPTNTYQGNTFARFKNMITFSFRASQKKYYPRGIKPDIIMGSSPHLFAPLSALALAKRYQVPFLLEIRDLWPESLVDLGKISTHHPLIKLMRLIEGHLYKKATHIISLLPAVHHYLTKFKISHEKIMWLPNAIDLTIIPKELPIIENDKFTFMYAGAHGLANDLETVIQAGEILEQKGFGNKIRICLIGNGPEKKHLQALADKANLKIIEFHDAVSKQAIYPILNKADAFLMLLKNSPVFRFGISPNKLFDYLSMGKPIIFGVDTPYNPIEKCGAGISIKPSDKDALADAMIKLASTNKDQLKIMGERGKAYVLEHHNIQHLTDKLENLMTSLNTNHTAVL